jgi:hypothetical protein
VLRRRETETHAHSLNEQLAIWKALQAPAKPTPSQKRFGALMRGETASSVPPWAKS